MPNRTPTPQDRAALPGNVLDRVDKLEYLVRQLSEYAAMAARDQNTGEIVPVGHFAGDTILLYDSGGLPLTEYPATDAGLSSGLAAMTTGDVLEIPAVTISGGPWTLVYGTLRGIARNGSILDGQLVMSNATKVENLSIIRSIDIAGVCYGILDSAGLLTAIINNVAIDVANATGAAYAVYMANGGIISAYDTELLAETGSTGYSVYSASGDFYHYGGRALGTTALFPYFITV